FYEFNNYFKEMRMDRSEQIKLCIGYYWIMSMQFEMLIDRNCIWELRMGLNVFINLCELLQVYGGLDKDGHVGIGEQVATFLIILAHYTKNHSVQGRFYRYGETISRYFHKVLCSVLRFQSKLFAKKDLVPKDCGCLGVLDETYIDVTVPKRSYYLVDAGYTNGRRFLSPYRNICYHVNEWIQGHRASQNLISSAVLDFGGRQIVLATTIIGRTIQKFANAPESFRLLVRELRSLAMELSSR
ncbi:hypothetical protein S83_032634, partial [Arachis hypogaea]